MDDVDLMVFDEGQRGIRLETVDTGKPRECPGMGGWKRYGEVWTTRIIGGDAASRLLYKAGPDAHTEFGGSMTLAEVMEIVGGM